MALVSAFPNTITKNGMLSMMKPRTNYLVKNPKLKNWCKRKSEEVVLETGERKKPKPKPKLKMKMDGATTLICYNILNEVMDFDIVNKSESLENIKQKLEQDKYQFAEQFEADVRRTFATAMLCNPSDEHYHESVKELVGIFDRLWKPVLMRKSWEELLKPPVEPLKSVEVSKEKNKIKAKVEGVKSIARVQSEYELKKQREAEREASRIALDKMEKSAVIDDNWKVQKDLEAIMRQPLVNMKKNEVIKGPLEKLGLYIKEEYKLGNENDYCISMDDGYYWEEGEIIC